MNGDHRLGRPISTFECDLSLMPAPWLTPGRTLGERVRPAVELQRSRCQPDPFTHGNHPFPDGTYDGSPGAMPVRSTTLDTRGWRINDRRDLARRP